MTHPQTTISDENMKEAQRLTEDVCNAVFVIDISHQPCFEKAVAILASTLQSKDAERERAVREARNKALEDAEVAASNMQAIFLTFRAQHTVPPIENLPSEADKEAWLLRMANEMVAAIRGMKGKTE